ncbi:hypothetical protein TNCT_379671 [Trichonephila clavata]|uniref:Uncharacterized protein n=1 Tax=Trichonephila clavata TaxID=2740835 RepID=A0A8X6LGP8_TRICU|nr:hypothetical protein TNCT_379671 [Trichonephila clavata]
MWCPANTGFPEMDVGSAPSSLSKRATEWESDSGHMSDVLPRGSQTLKRPQPRRHHTVGFETGSMTSLPRPSLDLETYQLEVVKMFSKNILGTFKISSTNPFNFCCGSWCE